MTAKDAAESDYMFEFLDCEYRELNNNLRECWKYISELLKTFLYLQIVLISLIFLGGGVIKVEKVVVTSKYETKSNFEKGNYISNSDHSKNTTLSPMNFLESVRWVPIAALIFLGLGSSGGAYLQNARLFSNATKLVRRAAYLEELANFPEDNRDTVHGNATLPSGRLLYKELYSDDKGMNLKPMLSGTYIIFGIVWIFYIIGFILYYISINN
ncbi:hypothetical protein WNZ15_22460 [Roseibium sp. AS2]|uniref:hypothetical protein n=1 Tax=Roseibium sp. AS2 TaxID=3135781 RepID=UPI00316B8EE8